FAKLDRFEDLSLVARHLEQASPGSLTAFGWLSRSLVKLKHWEECERIAEERLKRLADDPDAIRTLALAARLQGNPEKAERLGLRLTASGKAEAVDFNNLAWDALIGGSVKADTIQAAQRAAMLSQNHDAETLHTLASVYAEVGKTGEAREIL